MTNGLPEFSQFVEYIVEGEHGEPVVLPLPLDQQALDNLYTLEALDEGYARVAQYGRTPTLDAAALDALKDAALEVYHQDVVDNEITSSDPERVVERLLWVRDRAEWWAGMDAERGAVYWDEGTLWRCIQSHKTQADWRPGAPGAAALWTRYYALNEVHEWIQPLGAQDAWALGARVTHNGHTWQSLIANNVWEPGAAGSETLWACEDCEPETDEWAAGIAYTGDNTAGAGNGDVVTYLGATYRCLQSHTSQAGWTPSAVPALWFRL